MPTVHHAPRAFLRQLGVRDPPRAARDLPARLRRDPAYFCLPPAAGAAADAATVGVGVVDVLVVGVSGRASERGRGGGAT